MKKVIMTLVLFSGVIANAGPQQYEAATSDEAAKARVEAIVAKVRVAQTCVIDAEAITQKHKEVRELWGSEECTKIRDILGDGDEYLQSESKDGGSVHVRYFKIYEIPQLKEFDGSRFRQLMNDYKLKRPPHSEYMEIYKW